MTEVSGGSVTYAKGTGSIAFSTNTAQTVDLYGFDVEPVISSNTSAGGLTFVSSFTTPMLYVNTAGLGSAATIYFHGTSTFTISTFTMIGSMANHVVLKSTSSDQWYLNNTSTHSVNYVEVSSSNAGPGLEIMAYNSVDLGNNVGWNFGDYYRYWVASTAGGPTRRVIRPAQ